LPNLAFVVAALVWRLLEDKSKKAAWPAASCNSLRQEKAALAAAAYTLLEPFSIGGFRCLVNPISLALAAKDS
jgi:hypothetical protein